MKNLGIPFTAQILGASFNGVELELCGGRLLDDVLGTFISQVMFSDAFTLFWNSRTMAGTPPADRLLSCLIDVIKNRYVFNISRHER